MAEKGRVAFNAYMKKKRGKGGSNGGGKRKVNALIAKYTEGMDDDEVEAFLSSKSPSKAAKKDSSKGDSQCFTIMLPHIKIGVGSLSNATSLALSVVYDTAAVVNVGNADFHLAFAKRFPHTVKSIIWAEDKFTQLTLSGVVSKGADDKQVAALSTLLPVVIEYHMPYKRRAKQEVLKPRLNLRSARMLECIQSSATVQLEPPR
eukprot:scaffold76438_cov60-Attheya_sp.AAC.2